MKKKGLLIFGGATYLLSLLLPATVTTNNSVVKATTIAATQPTNAQYNSTLVVPVTTGSAITACEKISTDGTLSPTNAEDIYELDVQESALNVSLSGSLGNNPGYFYVSICSPTGEELTNFTVSNTTAITDTATGRRSDSIQSISLSQGKYLCKVAFRHNGLHQTGDAPTENMPYTLELSSIDASETQNISLNQEYVAYGEKVQYKQIKVEEAGMLTVQCDAFRKNELSNFYAGVNVSNYKKYIVLCDENKNEITDAFQGNTVTYGVKKGTYYIKIYSTIYYNLEYYTYSVAFSKGELGNSQKGKAETRTGKSTNYIMPAGSSKKASSKWMKVSLKKAQKKNWSIKNETNGTIQVAFYQNGKCISKINISSGKRNKLCPFKKGKVTKWNKGTTYVKITKSSTSQNGVVNVKMK